MCCTRSESVEFWLKLKFRFYRLFGIRKLSFYKDVDPSKSQISSFWQNYIWKSGWNEAKIQPSDNFGPVLEGGVIHVYYQKLSWLKHPMKVKCSLEDFVGANRMSACFKKVELSQKEYNKVLNAS